MPSTLAQKLQLKPDQPLALVNTPAGYQKILASEMPANPLVTVEGDKSTSALLLFVNNLEEARRLMSEAINQMAPDGLMWLAYPKGSSRVKTDINRDILWAELQFTGWRPVRQVAIDETWSALRYRPGDRVTK